MWGIPLAGVSSVVVVDVVLAVVALIAMLVLGTVAHELAHAVVLRTFGVPVEMAWFPDRGDTPGMRAVLSSRWAAVTPRTLPRSFPSWRLRVAALSPFALAVPMPFVLLGVLPDPTMAGHPALATATIAWFACALPSPQDFSLFWHAEAAIAEHRGGGSAP